MSCQGSVPEAIIAFLESENFEDCIRKAISLGGDSDTIASMAGGIAEVFYGIPYSISHEIQKYLPFKFKDLLVKFYNKIYWNMKIPTKIYLGDKF